MSIVLRPHQVKAHHMIIAELKKGNKILFVMQGGGGKTITISSFVNNYKQHFKFAIIVRKRNLVNQFAEDGLDKFDLDYSVFMSGHPKLDKSKNIQVCSKDTLQARDYLPFLGEKNVIIIIDEGDEYVEWQKEIIKKYTDAGTKFGYIAMTASPYTCLDHLDVVVEPIKPKELLKAGILVPYDYVIPHVINTDDVEIIDGEFKKEQVLKKYNTPSAIKACFDWWISDGKDRQTFVFCSSKDHAHNFAKHINNHFNRAMAVAHDADTPENIRQVDMRLFKAFKIKFLVMVRLYTRGTDAPCIGTILDAAMTLRINTHLQKITRGSRSNEYYDDCILIDCANNCETLGGVYTDREIDLTSSYKKSKADLEVISMRVCERCFRGDDVENFKNNTCPFCEFCNEPLKVKKLSKEKEKKLWMEHASEEAIEQKQMISAFKKKLWQNKHLSKLKDHKMYTIFYMLDTYGFEKCSKISKTIGLTGKILNTYNSRKEAYVPLGGMKI